MRSIHKTISSTACAAAMVLGAALADDMERIEHPRIDATAGLTPDVELGPTLPRHKGFRPAAGRYHYVATMNGAEVGSGKITVNPKSVSNLLVNVTAKAADAVANLYTLSFRGEAHLRLPELSPIDAMTREQTGRRIKLVSAEFSPDGIVSAIEFKRRPGKKDKRTSRKFKSDGQLLDPFGAAFIAQSLQWKKEAEEQLLILLGSKRYLVTLHCEGKSKVTLKGAKPRDTWRIKITGEKVDADSDDEEEQESEAKVTTHVYIGTDEKREVLRVRSASIIGTIDVDLRKFEPKNREPE